MTKLLYHLAQDDGGKTAVSPFDEAVLQVARSGPVRIVSPYIGVAYLERITSLSSQWRLISDVQEWLSSLSTQTRPRAWQFIRDNLDLIHHCHALHAKAVISDSLAMMGSANLTQHGILGRTEMGILLDNPQLVAEMGVWFDDLWAETAPPIVDETSAYIQWLDEEASQAPARRQRFALSSTSRKVRARLVKLELAVPPSGQVEDAPLNLSQVAQAIIVQDQNRYDSLEAALEDSINKLTTQGTFTLGQLATEIRRGFTGTNLREIYFLLVQHCANHVRSVFVETTQNRLILADSHFAQSSKESLLPALAAFDAFLVALVGILSFATPVELPTEEQLEQETGFGGRDQVILVSELLDCGFLIIDDRPGELPGYMLDGSFDWEGRFRFFRRAHAAWTAKQKKTIPDNNVPEAADTEVRHPATTYGVLRRDQLPEVEDDEPVEFDLGPTWAENRSALRRLLQESAVDLALADKAKQRVKVDLSLRGKPPGDKAQRQLGYVDTLLSRLLGMLGDGKAFIAPNMRGVQQAIRKATGNRPEIIEAALDAGVFRLARREDSHQLMLEINPQLSWDVLANYPKTSAVCAALIGEAPPITASES